MGALFSTKIPKASPPPVPPISAPGETEEAERRARIAALLRRRRGRLGLIATSTRGVVGPAGAFGRRKSLLGE